MLNIMRKPWLALIFCLPVVFAADKNRDWKEGQILEPKPPYDSRIHTVAGVEKNYVVRGSFGEAEDTLVAGTPIKYALQGNTMYLSLKGKEYKLTVIGATMKAAAPPPTVPTVPVPAATAAQSGVPVATPPFPPSPPIATTPVAPVAQSDANVASAPGAITLDNDAVVKMIVGGLREDTVIGVIQARPGKYVMDPDAVTALKAAGIPQRVIDAMGAKSAAPQR